MIRVGGTFYGTTAYGGAYEGGAVFKFTPVSNAETILSSFAGGNDGRIPYWPLLFLHNSLYGTTYAGGPQDFGTIFKLDPATGTETLLHSFNGGGDGWYPTAGLIGVGGLLYGTTSGTIFNFDLATGIEKTIYAFTGGNDGTSPNGLTKVGSLLYGTTAYGGASQAGTVFSFDPATLSLKTLYAFSYNDGFVPTGPLTAVQGALYGTTQAGGPASAGNIFKINLATGALTVLYNFTNGADGGTPCSPLIAIGTVLYGGTCTGGARNLGTAFSLQP